LEKEQVIFTGLEDEWKNTRLDACHRNIGFVRTLGPDKVVKALAANANSGGVQ
jgi:hypothetical protein